MSWQIRGFEPPKYKPAVAANEGDAHFDGGQAKCRCIDWVPDILQHGRIHEPPPQIAGDIITDDFAPADAYDVMGQDLHR
jgi:hypothetical protein